MQPSTVFDTHSLHDKTDDKGFPEWRTSKILWGLLVFTVLKILLLFLVPLTGDEAYFIIWGQQFEPGYYDHPPAVGWLLWLMSHVSTDLSWYRSFAFVTSIVITYLLYQWLRLFAGVSQTRAEWAALIFWVSPVSAAFVLTANDTVLVLFASLGFYWFSRALQTHSWWFIVSAGMALGMAFLSKYFTVFLMFGLLAYVLVFSFRKSDYHSKINWFQIIILAAIVMLFVAQNLWFNYHHCWNNILFNFFSRTRESSFGITNLIIYIVVLMLLLSPLGLAYWKRQQNELKAIPSLLWFSSLPLLVVLVLVSLENFVGVHWMLISVVWLWASYAWLKSSLMPRLYWFNVILSASIAMVILILPFFLMDLMKGTSKLRAPIYLAPAQICQQLPQGEMFTLGYSSQATLSQHCQRKDLHVFASTSKYGREDDKRTNYAAMNGQEIKILLVRKSELKKITPYFEGYRLTPMKPVEGQTYLLFTGRNFNYELYREKLLVPIYEKYYKAPDFLPKSSCSFAEKYGITE